MARIEAVERRLLEWAQWLKVGDGSGYPSMSMLHEAWTPPTKGMVPTMKAAPASSARATHRAIGRLSTRLANTLVVHYVLNLSVADQAAKLECEQRTVHARVEQAQRMLEAILADDVGI